MIISDNGVGLPDTVDIGQSPSLGLQLVDLLTMQIGGKIELDRMQGATYQITAPLYCNEIMCKRHE
jgi:two-component sensor histidine kinase